MIQPTCETCRFWIWPNFETFTEQVRTASGPGSCRIRSVPTDTFPQRHMGDWCGEHQPKEASKE